MFYNLSLKRTFIVLSSLFISIILCIPGRANSDVKVQNIKHFSSQDYTRVVIELSGQVEFNKCKISNPERIFFDLKNSYITKEIKTVLPVGDGILKSVRASQYNSETVRVVLDIEEISDWNYFIIENPARLIIDLKGKNKKSNSSVFLAKRRIVIDPGHGGHDPGAVGPKKLYEKNVVLDIALKLRKILQKNPMNEVFLTRESDIYLPLEERTAIANKKNADLFISIHANASPNREARGVETYLLNWTDDEEAMKVAARENKISLRKMRAMKKQFDILETIKTDLMRENKRDESVKLANYIQRSIISGVNEKYKNIIDHGVKQAMFYVLLGANMPSILAEVSFISNPQEENLLSNETYREEIAKALAEGIDTYFKSSPAIQKVAELTFHGLQ
ncbi:MAG: N-acetylmuramoyl-L-alanine amidase [Nitrospirae bacterium]|jgi:N-acetylmuramoyl-L-alanine amidase|nr:N-acetylmuramoyl-L-alanine amidase [Nitrospirota bacterium]